MKQQSYDVCITYILQIISQVVNYFAEFESQSFIILENRFLPIFISYAVSNDKNWWSVDVILITSINLVISGKKTYDKIMRLSKSIYFYLHTVYPWP